MPVPFEIAGIPGMRGRLPWGEKYGNGLADAREEGSVQKTERQQGVVKKAVAKKVAARVTN